MLGVGMGIPMVEGRASPRIFFSESKYITLKTIEATISTIIKGCQVEMPLIGKTSKSTRKWHQARLWKIIGDCLTDKWQIEDKRAKDL